MQKHSSFTQASIIKILHTIVKTLESNSLHLSCFLPPPPSLSSCFDFSVTHVGLCLQVLASVLKLSFKLLPQFSEGRGLALCIIELLTEAVVLRLNLRLCSLQCIDVCSAVLKLVNQIKQERKGLIRSSSVIHIQIWLTYRHKLLQIKIGHVWNMNDKLKHQSSMALLLVNVPLINKQQYMLTTMMATTFLIRTSTP